MNEISLPVLQTPDMALLMFECLTALSSSDAKWKELHEQGTLQKMFRTLNGQNARLRSNIQKNVITAQHAAVQMIEQLTKQQAASFSFLNALHDKITRLQLENDSRFQELLHMINIMYDDSSQKFERIFQHLHTQQKQLDCIEWRQNIPYATFNGTPYIELSPIDKLICAVSDFYTVTKGQWTTDDERYIAYFLNDLCVQQPINIRSFYTYIHQNTYAKDKLFSTISATFISPYCENNELFPIMNHTLQKDENVVPLTLALDILIQLTVIEQASKQPTSFSVILVSIPHVDERLSINRTLHKVTKLPLEQCRLITNRANIANNIKNDSVVIQNYHSLAEAKALKKALVSHKCSVDIMECF